MVRLGDDVARAIADPRSYAEWDDFHQMLVGVRRDTPFARAEIDDCHPFWVASKYDDIQSVSRQKTQFLSRLGGLQNFEALVQEGAIVSATGAITATPTRLGPATWRS